MVVTLVRWIDTLSHLGRVGATIDAIEAAASDAVRRRAEAPYLGGWPWTPPPPGADPVHATATGYVQHVDAATLDALAESHGLILHLAVLPGRFVHPGQPLVEIDGTAGPELRERIAKAFVVGKRRTFDDDPRFGIIVLTEVAQRALSTSVNDPGTAIDVIGTLVRVLSLWAERRAAAPEAGLYPRLRVPGLSAAELFDDAFGPIAQDGAGTLLVGLRLRKALAILHATGDAEFRSAARRQADLALQRAEAVLPEPDRVRLREACPSLA